MTLLGMSEQSNTFKYAVLSTKVVQVLRNIAKDKQLSESEKNTLQRGSNLLLKIVEGATLVEGKEFTDNLTPSQEGLTAYGYALSTLSTMKILGSIKNHDGFTDFFTTLYTEITNIQKRQKERAEATKLLIEFFTALGSSFRHDLKKERYHYPTDKHPLLRRSSLNALSVT